MPIEGTPKDLSNATSNRKAVERANTKLAQSKKQTIGQMEAYFDKCSEVHRIKRCTSTSSRMARPVTEAP